MQNIVPTHPYRIYSLLGCILFCDPKSSELRHTFRAFHMALNVDASGDLVWLWHMSPRRE